MAHHDRAHDTTLNFPLEWQKSNWLTHPTCKALLETPDRVELGRLLSKNEWSDQGESLWALRVAFFHIQAPGMRSLLMNMFEAGCIPLNRMKIWPHPNLRARFLRDEIGRVAPTHSSYEIHQNWLRCLAVNWPWLWQEDARHQGMGEAHPIARLTRAGHECVIALLTPALSPSQWLDWSDSQAERMIALLVRRGSVANFQHLVKYDTRLLAWRHRKDQRTLLHEACAKLRPDIVAILLKHGASPVARSKPGLTPAYVAVNAVIEGHRTRGLSSSKSNELTTRLDEVLTALATAGGLEGSAEDLMAALKSDHLERMRGILQRALLSSSTAVSEGSGSSRRL